MGFIEWIKSLFSRFVRVFKELLAEAFPLARQVIAGQLRDIALTAVSELASTDLSNEEKRKQAFAKIKAYAIAKGINARDSLINAIIELAVLKFKEEF